MYYKFLDVHQQGTITSLGHTELRLTRMKQNSRRKHEKQNELSNCKTNNLTIKASTLIQSNYEDVKLRGHFKNVQTPKILKLRGSGCFFFSLQNQVQTLTGVLYHLI